jgi:hypothetical protein
VKFVDGLLETRIVLKLPFKGLVILDGLQKLPFTFNCKAYTVKSIIFSTKHGGLDKVKFLDGLLKFRIVLESTLRLFKGLASLDRSTENIFCCWF